LKSRTSEPSGMLVCVRMLLLSASVLRAWSGVLQIQHTHTHTHTDPYSQDMQGAGAVDADTLAAVLRKLRVAQRRPSTVQRLHCLCKTHPHHAAAAEQTVRFVRQAKHSNVTGLRALQQLPPRRRHVQVLAKRTGEKKRLVRWIFAVCLPVCRRPGS
jgi:hypothetical protein